MYFEILRVGSLKDRVCLRRCALWLNDITRWKKCPNKIMNWKWPRIRCYNFQPYTRTLSFKLPVSHQQNFEILIIIIIIIIIILRFVKRRTQSYGGAEGYLFIIFFAFLITRLFCSSRW